MAKRGGARAGGQSGRSSGRPSGGSRSSHGKRAAGGGANAGGSGARRSASGRGAPREASADAEPADEPHGPFRLGAIPGATPGTWIDRWNERMPDAPLELVPIQVAGQRDALDELDAALVRLPIDGDGLHVIALYDELPVVVMPADSHLTAADELTASDLSEEVLITPADDVLDVHPDGTVAPRFAAPATTEEAIETVGAGVGIVIVPMSLARLHHRKDVAHRTLVDGPTSTVALAWIAERTTPAVEAFVGIVRGRTANSSRG
jgi:hypothetical protein